ncbi:MAG: hypothetical protein JSU77_00830 [Fidelibacterota bacterium]|nr:MAG: hypothetical protein JSU77_00830 [Candidatus Neomarinimicrobiota bacterium]
MKSGHLIVVISLLPMTLSAQTEFFGYFETEQDLARISGQQYNYGYSKLRLDMMAYPAESVTIGANLNIRRLSGQKTWNMLDFLPKRIWEPVFGDSGEFPITLADTLYLDNVFIKLNFPLFDITVGKQQISLGTGYAWNPVDIFNIKELLDPTYEQAGVTALRMELPLVGRSGLDLILVPEDSWENSAKMVQGKVGLGSFDLTANITEYKAPNPYWRLPIDTTTPPSTHTVRQRIGGSLVGEVLGIGIWGEGLWDLKDQPIEFDEYLIGIDHTFDFRTYLMVEYYHNGGGVADRDSLQFSDFTYSLSGQSHSLMQDYAFVVVHHPLTDLISLGLLGFANLNDQSYMVAPSLEWSAFENVNISLLLSHAQGGKDSEFGMQEWGLRLRLRAYF